MNRRRFLTTLGAAAGTTSLTLGSGAFTTVSAERTVSVDVADDFVATLVVGRDLQFRAVDAAGAQIMMRMAL